MKTSQRTQQADSVDTASAEARAQLHALAAQRMSEFLDGLPREAVNPSAPTLTQKDINALVHEIGA